MMTTKKCASEIRKHHLRAGAKSNTNFAVNLFSGLKAEKLEWGNVDQISQILERHPRGFDLILGADIYILFISFLLYCLLRPFIFVLND